jgi:hypothetical protein
MNRSEPLRRGTRCIPVDSGLSACLRAGAPQDVISRQADSFYGVAMMPHALLAADAVRLLSTGELTSTALVADCLRRIADEEPQVQAWEFLDAELALAQARRADAAGRPGRSTGCRWA